MVVGYTGLPGSGKTFQATARAVEALKAGRKVYSNYPIHGAFLYEDLSQVLAVRDGVIIVDEINLVCPSRWFNKLPPKLAYFWSQTRKFGLDIYWTAQHIDRVEKIVREISNWVWVYEALPLGFHKGLCFIPEHVGKEKARAFDRKLFRISKKIYAHYDTKHPISLPSSLDDGSPIFDFTTLPLVPPAPMA